MTPPQRASREVNKFRECARVVIDHHFGRPKRVIYLSAGMSNFVFAFSTADGDFIIRISPDAAGIKSFIKEQWAVREASKVGIPAPEILEVGTGMIDHPYMVSRTTKGSEARFHPNRLEILREMGRIGAAINSIKTKGFGETFDWSDNRLSFNNSFKEYLETEYNFGEKIETLKKHRMLSPQQAKKLERTFTEAAKSRAHPVLTHGDLRLKNVIADEDGKIKAIIDWEGCISSIAPAWELSIALHDLGIDEMQFFLEGYGITEKKLSDSMPLIRAFNIANYAAAVAGIAAAKNKPLLAHYRLRLGGMLDLYSV